MDIRIQSIHFDADKKLEAFIEKRLSKLEKFYSRIVNAEVFLKLENDASAPVREKVAEIKLQVPGKTLYASESAKQFEEAINLTARSLERQIKREKEKYKK